MLELYIHNMYIPAVLGLFSAAMRLNNDVHIHSALSAPHSVNRFFDLIVSSAEMLPHTGVKWRREGKVFKVLQFHSIHF